MSIDWVKDELKKRAMTMTDLSRITGLAEGTISNAFKGKRTPRYQTIRAIANALGIPVQEFMRRCTS